MYVLCIINFFLIHRIRVIRVNIAHTCTHHGNGFSVQYEVGIVDRSSFDVVSDPPLTYTCKRGQSLHSPKHDTYTQKLVYNGDVSAIKYTYASSATSAIMVPSVIDDPSLLSNLPWVK